MNTHRSSSRTTPDFRRLDLGHLVYLKPRHVHPVFTCPWCKLTKIRILFFAESPSTPEAEVYPGEGWVVVAVLNGFVCVVLVLECNETVIVTVNKSSLINSQYAKYHTIHTVNVQNRTPKIRMTVECWNPIVYPKITTFGGSDFDTFRFRQLGLMNMGLKPNVRLVL